METTRREDHYTVLGLDRGASSAQIKTAYRHLARTLHPDINPDPRAGERFKVVTAAHQVLSDPKKRLEYDQAQTIPRQDRAPRSHAPAARGRGRTSPPGAQPRTSRPPWEAPTPGRHNESRRPGQESGDRLGRRRERPQQRAADTFIIDLSLAQTLTGHQTWLPLEEGRTPLWIPPGARSNEMLWGPEIDPNLPDDVWLNIHVNRDSGWSRQGDDLCTTIPISVSEAALGAVIDVTLPTGEHVPVRVRPGLGSSIVRTPEKGFPARIGSNDRGDLVTTLRLELPKTDDPRVRRILEELQEVAPVRREA